MLEQNLRAKKIVSAIKYNMNNKMEVEKHHWNSKKVSCECYVELDPQNNIHELWPIFVYKPDSVLVLKWHIYYQKALT